MNNEKASVSVECHFNKADQGISPMLMINKGDIYQNYKGTHTAPVCEPNYTAADPLLAELWLTKSDGNIAAASDISNVDWYVGSVKLGFASDTKKCNSPAAFVGVFQRVDASGSTKPALKIIQNLVTPLAGLSSYLKAVATITDANGNPKTKSVSAEIKIRQVTDDSYSLSIRAVSGQLAITANNQELLVTAEAYNALTSLTIGTDCKLLWDLYIDGAWTRRTETSTGRIKILEKEVQSCMLIRAALCSASDVTTANYASLQFDDPDAANYVQPLAVDTAVIYDTSDPYVITPHPTPEDCIIGDGVAATKITFAPVMERRDGTPAPGTVTFTAKILSVSGVVMRNVAQFAAGGSFDITVADFNQSSDVNTVIDGTCTITT